MSQTNSRPEPSVMVAMRDGVRLATDIHLPPGPGPFPVILERTPYGRGEVSRSEITAADRRPLPIRQREQGCGPPRQ